MLGDKSIPHYIRDENYDGKIDLDDYNIYKMREDHLEDEKRKKSHAQYDDEEDCDFDDDDDIDLDDDIDIEDECDRADDPYDDDDELLDDDYFDVGADIYEGYSSKENVCLEREITIEIKVEDSSNDSDKHFEKMPNIKDKKRTYSKSGKVNCALIKSRKKRAWEYLDNADFIDADEKERLRFIVAGKVTASDYLTLEGRFLYAQAIKDHFAIPFDVEDEEFEPAALIGELIEDIASIDAKYAVEIWDWCLDTFSPYLEYLRDYYREELFLLYYNMSDKMIDEIAERMKNDPSFIDKVAKNAPSFQEGIDRVIGSSIMNGNGSTARQIVESVFANKDIDARGKISLIQDVMNACENYDEVETIELFRDEVFPIMYRQTDARIKVKMSEWERDMTEYIDRTLSESDKYLYSRYYAWREKYRVEREFTDVDPVDHSTEEEYLEAVNYRKYGWRENCCNSYGVDANDYETEAEYDNAVKQARARLWEAEKAEKEKRMQAEKEERERLIAKRIKERAERIDSGKDRIVSFCKVLLDGSASAPVYYSAGERRINLGDRVIVPFGNGQLHGTVVSVGECFASALSFPIEKMKTVIDKE